VKEMVKTVTVPRKQVTGTVQRSHMTYPTEVEYGSYAMTPVVGCAHGCKYPCYAFLNKKRWGKVAGYEEWCCPLLVDNTLELLAKEIPRLQKRADGGAVQLSFATDPFMFGYSDVREMSLKSIAMLNEAGIHCTTLTKGILPLELACLSKDNEHGISLISLNESFREAMEPGAAPYAVRLQALKNLHDAGCKTWISMEPYPTPNIIEQDIWQILETISFVDKIVFGRWNYNSEIRRGFPQHREFYNEMAMQVVKFCDTRGITYHIKDGTFS